MMKKKDKGLGELRFALVAWPLLASVGCGPHVVLSAPPRSAPLAERQAAYRALRPVFIEQTSYNAGTTRSVDTELRLADGTNVYHVEDILTVVPDDSESARLARKSMRKDSTSTTFALIGTLSAVVCGALLLGAGSSAEGSSNWRSIGLATSGLSASGFGIASYFVSQSASDDAVQAYQHYDAGLQKRLSLCVGASCGIGVIRDTRAPATTTVERP